MRFRYTAIDGTGGEVTGELEAADREAALRVLQHRGLQPKTIDATGCGPDEAVSLTGMDFQELSGHIAEITQANLPLAPGLRAAADELPGGRLRWALLQIAADLDAGRDLQTVLAARRAPRDLQALIRVGVRGGSLADVLGHYVSHARQLADVRRRMLSGLAYPLVLAGVGSGIFAFFAVYLVPKFQRIFEDFGAALPTATVLLIAVSDVLVYHGWWIVPLAAVVFLGGWMFVRGLIGAAAMRHVVCSLPIIGPLLRSAAMARFSRTLATLIECRVPLPEALELAGEASCDAELQFASRELAGQVQRGEVLTPGIFSLAGFSPAIARHLSRREQTETLADLLHTLADMFYSRTRVQAMFLVWVFKFVFLVGLVLGMGFLVIALFAPLIGLLNSLA